MFRRIRATLASLLHVRAGRRPQPSDITSRISRTGVHQPEFAEIILYGIFSARHARHGGREAHERYLP